MTAVQQVYNTGHLPIGPYLGLKASGPYGVPEPPVQVSMVGQSGTIYFPGVKYGFTVTSTTLSQ